VGPLEPGEVGRHSLATFSGRVEKLQREGDTRRTVTLKDILSTISFEGNISWQGSLFDSGMVACSEFIRTF
jgi:hypothetical protein